MSWRYGHPAPPVAAERDELLDRFMPMYEVREHHQVHVDAPADVTFEAATHLNLSASSIARAIFSAREWIMRSHSRRAPKTPKANFLESMEKVGWGRLAEVPGREVIMGATTQPWLADVVFTPRPPAEFAAFRAPGYVKIVWTLRVEPAGQFASVFSTETRAVPTDDTAREKFRRYWMLMSPGIFLIRWLALEPLKKDAEARAHGALPGHV